MKWRAQCGCGALSAELTGSATAVVACHCVACQRRTGSPFGVGVYFPSEAVELTGTAKEYLRPTDSGRTLKQYFCPHCGSTVYWRTERHPSLIGVALGSIADPAFPAPQRSVWEESKHEWVRIDVGERHFMRGTPS